ncbi:MAG: glutamine--fructose-6-phosphate transaminase (isomerizing) [Candidatus Aenigmarchaeota archaeon]|nr:glutamine--fructose-6-phosphate transaminase (isomerizing) [Candidatus Aenigmarchaeota archaeon]
MCGIVGFAFRDSFEIKDSVKALKRLEYRGYDSFGYADNNGVVGKHVGEIAIDKVPALNTKIAITHTRWSTHGGVTEMNAHPHTDCSGKIAIVHNGIISNYREIREEMEKAGHAFKSQTDSEAIAHFFENKNIKDAAPEFFSKFQGEFAVLLVKKAEEKIYAFKRGSPLVLGIAPEGNILASDIYAFSDRTNRAVFFNEDEFAEITSEGFTFYSITDTTIPIEKEITVFSWKEGEELGEYPHYMIKEIKEIPRAASRLLLSLGGEQKPAVEKVVRMLKDAKRVIFVASGSSYHAALIGVQFLARAGMEARAVVASEFRSFMLLDENTVAVAVSQSGETMDVIEAMRGIKAKGVKIASLVNVPYSTVQRMSNAHLNIGAGQEVCVAATKTFINQVITMAYMASMLGYRADFASLNDCITKALLQEERIKEIAAELKDERDIYILGRGVCYPVAREIALKLKEIAYVHAEGMMAGELKHGTLALIEKGTPVICLMPKNDKDIVSSAEEVKARGAKVISFTSNGYDSEEGVKINATDAATFAIASAIVGQILTYYIAMGKGLPIDKPRNLAKSVTVK